MANPFTFLELHSTDATRAKSFYAELFGWKTKDTPCRVSARTPRSISRRAPGARLTAQREPGARSAWLAYIRVPKIDETVARAQKLGATVITPRTDIKEGSFAVLQDPAGARIGVFQKAE